MLGHALFLVARSAAPCPDSDPIHDLAHPSDAPSAAVIPPKGVVPADPARLREPSPRVSLSWALSQLVPSPELGFGDDGAVFGLRWQLTPFLYSFATDPRLSRVRWFVVEPIVRQSGSIELFLSPEYLGIGETLREKIGGRVGVRSYFGVLERGDYLSLSIAAAYFQFGDERGVAYEAGAYVLFGVLGLQLGYAPALDQARWLSTLRLRFF